MRKQQTEYSSPLDALVAISKRLTRYEIQHSVSSEDFFARYQQGEFPDDSEFIEWANDYRHYLAIRINLEQKLKHAA